MPRMQRCTCSWPSYTKLSHYMDINFGCPSRDNILSVQYNSEIKVREKGMKNKETELEREGGGGRERERERMYERYTIKTNI